ncbi:uncharacterized protein [Amphiura filiformis]|uniref:uncharacterized protein n=1 Tax=Amphiura filiformis TaxID=82378 RepID=UPI003B21FAF6
MASNTGNSRFKTINEEQLQELINSKDSVAKRRSTESAVAIFREYLKSKGENINLEEFSKERLASVLTKFYAEIQHEDGTPYKTGSLKNLRNGLNRHLKNKGQAIDLRTEAVFAESNLTFDATKAELKHQGFGDTKSYSPIDENDVLKLYESGVFNQDTPQCLQNKVWFELILYICLRGRENLRKLERDHFAIGEDSNGRRYVYQAK